ncbi:MAG: dTDP-4-dehydrorhamnose reductase [Thioalkalivibrionaceae bacterium]
MTNAEPSASTRRILVLGARGQVGWALGRTLATHGALHAWDVTTHAEADFLDAERLMRAVDALDPHWVINAAAYTAVDRAESEPERAEIINAQIPSQLAEWCAGRGARFVHYSTDYVFDGSGDAPRREGDPCAPLNVYGRTKLLGEQGARASGAEGWILRTSWVFSSFGQNFVRTVLRLATSREDLGIVADQIGAPTSAELLAEITARLLNETEPQGMELLHCVAAGETSWHGLANEVLRAALAEGWALKVRPEGLRALTTAEYPTPARRPLNSRLDTSRLQARLSLVLPDWRDGVRRAVHELSPPERA